MGDRKPARAKMQNAEPHACASPLAPRAGWVRFRLAEGGISGIVKKPEGPWKMVFENQDLVRLITRRYRLNLLAGSSNREDVESIVLYSLFKSAGKWDEKKGPYRPYAIKCGRECIQEVLSLQRMVYVEPKKNRLASDYLRKTGGGQEYGIDEFAEREGVPPESVGSLKMAVNGVSSNRSWKDSHALFNGLAGIFQGGNPNVCELENPLAMQGEAERRMDLHRIRERIKEIFMDALSGEEYATVCRFLMSNSPSQDEIAKKMGVSRQMVSRIEKRAMRKLRKYPHSEALGECLRALDEYSTG
jgi:RNA polymerase sigma factor (sigma-70 family)